MRTRFQFGKEKSATVPISLMARYSSAQRSGGFVPDSKTETFISSAHFLHHFQTDSLHDLNWSRACTLAISAGHLEGAVRAGLGGNF